MPGIICSVVTDYRAALTGDWVRLWERDPAREVFQHAGWARAWASVWGERYPLFAPAAFEGGRMTGILPLVKDGRRLRFLGFTSSDYNRPLCDPLRLTEFLQGAFEELFRRAGEWDTLMLEHVPEDVELLETVAGTVRKQMIHCNSVPCPALDLGEDKEKALTQLLGKEKVKKTVRAFGRAGTVEFRHLEERSEARRHLPEFFRQHIRRQSVVGRISAFCNPAARAFYESTVEHMDPSRELRFSVLELNGRPAAYHFGFEANGRYLYYKPAFDVDLESYSPGQVLLYELFRQMRSAAAAEFDFCQGGEAYKYRFANRTKRVCTYRVESPGLAGALRLSRLRTELAARAYLNRHPKLKDRVRTMMGGGSHA